MQRTKILLIYTGGTIGMMQNPETNSLLPFDFSQIVTHVPELQRFDYEIESISFESPVDSSDVNQELWLKLVEIIGEHYDTCEGFVILHGTDTMAYTASALSFMLENLDKSVILTGSQLPIGVLRTDGKENIITSIEIAASKRFGKSVVPEVCVYFENNLYRGNRVTKSSTEGFNAFQSNNYPPLATVGVHINFNYSHINYSKQNRHLKIYKKLNNQVAILKLFPGISLEVLNALFNIENLRAVVLETFGAGNAPSNSLFLDTIKKAIKKRIIILNVTQCKSGSVNMGQYDTSRELLNIGVLSGFDITAEAAVTKLMHLLGEKENISDIIYELKNSISGELTINTYQ